MKPWIRLGCAWVICANGFSQNQIIMQDKGERYYLHGFGGVYASDGVTMNQQGFIPFNNDNLAVSVVGRANFQNNGLVGGAFGYQVQNLVFNQKNSWHFIPAFEVEGFYLTSQLNASLVNPDKNVAYNVNGVPISENSLDAGQLRLENQFQYHAGFLFANVVSVFKGSIFQKLEPYLGLGLGATFDHLTASSSYRHQSENYFLPQNDAVNIVFAAQIKSGLRLFISPNMNLFAEYRYIYSAKSNYRMGSTLENAQWNLDFGTMHINAGVVGVGYYFDEKLKTSNSRFL